LIEKLRHKEAFEYYYILGEKRSYVEVGYKLGISETSISTIAKKVSRALAGR